MKPAQQNVEKEIEFFSQLVADHGELDAWSEEAYERVIALFEKHARPTKGEKCIDLGCGTGGFTRRLAAFQLRLTGMDVCPPAIDFAKANVAGINFIAGDIRRSGLPKNEFDLVIYSGVLHHFSAAKDRVAALREGLRILKPGGRLFAYDPNAYSPAMWLYRSPMSPLSSFFSEAGQTEDEILLSRGQLTEELTTAGFQQIRILGIGGVTLRGTASSIGGVILPFYNLYERAIRLSPFENRLGTMLLSFATKSTT